MKKFFLLFYLVAFHLGAVAQFSLVDVRMQSGEVRSIMSLPWFQYQLQIYEGSHTRHASTADWVVFSPPRFCPISAWYYVRWSGAITADDRKSIQEGCNKRMFEEKLASLPSDVKKVCECRLVLESESTIHNAQRAIWRSNDDELLLDEAYKLSAELVDNSGGRVPVLLTIGTKKAGIFSFDGSELCRYEIDIFHSQMKGIDRLRAFMGSEKRFNVPIQCVPDRRGEFNLGNITYSVLSRRITGEMKIRFEGGESYVIQIRQ